MWCKFGHEVVTFLSESRGTNPAYSTVRYAQTSVVARRARNLLVVVVARKTLERWESAHHAASRRAGNGQDRLADREELLDDCARGPPAGADLRPPNHFTESCFTGASLPHPTCSRRVALQKFALQSARPLSINFIARDHARRITLQKVALQGLRYLTRHARAEQAVLVMQIVARNRARWRKGPTFFKNGIHVLVITHFRDVSRRNVAFFYDAK